MGNGNEVSTYPPAPPSPTPAGIFTSGLAMGGN